MAGTWSELTYRKGSLNNAYSKPFGLVKTFTADAADASIPADELIDGVSGGLIGIDVEFDADAPPDSVTVAIKTVGGITLLTSSALTASGRVEVDPVIPFAGGLKILVTGNTTNSAVATIIPLVF